MLKSRIKAMLPRLLSAPIRATQAAAKVLGVQYFIQGDVFDLLLAETTRVSAGQGRSIVFHTPNALTRFRADSLLTKEPETIAWIDSFAPGSVFWDVGANVGVFSLYAAVRHPDLRIISVEPSIENTYLLNRNISTNSLSDRVAAFPFALSESSGPALFKHQKFQLGGALNSFGVDYSFDGKARDFIHTYSVFGFKADDLASVFGIPQPNYIKIDVDGIEHLIARGARRVLSDPGLRSVLIELSFDFPEQRNEILSTFAECGLELLRYEEGAMTDKATAFGRTYNHIFVRKS